MHSWVFFFHCFYWQKKTRCWNIIIRIKITRAKQGWSHVWDEFTRGNQQTNNNYSVCRRFWPTPWNMKGKKMQPNASHPLGCGGVGFTSIRTEMHEGQYSNDVLTILVALTVCPYRLRKKKKNRKNSSLYTTQRCFSQILESERNRWTLHFSGEKEKCPAITDQQTWTCQNAKLWKYELVALVVYIVINYINPLNPLHINGHLILSAKRLGGASCERDPVGSFWAQAKLSRCWEMKWDTHKQVADKLIWAAGFCKLGFAEVPLKFVDFRGSESLTLSSDEWQRLSCSSRFLFSFKLSWTFSGRDPATAFFFCSGIKSTLKRGSDEVHSYFLKLFSDYQLFCSA